MSALDRAIFTVRNNSLRELSDTTDGYNTTNTAV